MSFSSLAIFAAVVSAALCFAAVGMMELRRKRRDALLLRLRGLIGGDTHSPQARRRTENRLAQQVVALLWRAGIVPAPWQAWMTAGAMAIAALVGALLQGTFGLLLYPLLLLGGMYLLLLRRASARRRLMIEQLPVFIDHLWRAVSTGNTLDSAFTTATLESQAPLRGALERVVREIRLGGALEEALEQSARTYEIQELRVLTLAVAVNRRYGSSIQELLKSVVTMIRRSEAARREFRSLTGETRMSAWVLGLTPVAIGLFTLLTSPDYLSVLWQDPTGRTILGFGLGAQSLGALILWRMMRAF
jgi:tight adherence protein B